MAERRCSTPLVLFLISRFSIFRLIGCIRQRSFREGTIEVSIILVFLDIHHCLEQLASFYITHLRCKSLMTSIRCKNSIASEHEIQIIIDRLIIKISLQGFPVIEIAALSEFSHHGLRVDVVPLVRILP